MKKQLTYLTIYFLIISFTIVSCKKEKSGCDNGNLCFEIDGNTVSGTAYRQNLPNGRYRMYWTDGAVVNGKNVEIDIFGNTVAEYNITDNAGTTGDVSFKYNINDSISPVNYQGTSGALNLISIDNDVWSGRFSGIVTNGNATFELKNGYFSNVPKE